MHFSRCWNIYLLLQPECAAPLGGEWRSDRHRVPSPDMSHPSPQDASCWGNWTGQISLCHLQEGGCQVNKVHFVLLAATGAGALWVAICTIYLSVCSFVLVCVLYILTTVYCFWADTFLCKWCFRQWGHQGRWWQCGEARRSVKRRNWSLF